MSEKQIEYSVFCIENVAKQLGKSGAELFEILNSSGLLHSYIIPSYEVLHTQSKQYIVDEIISVLKERNLVAWKMMSKGISDFHCLSDAYLVDEILLENK